ncbi:transposase [Methylomagnum ishizawai]
MLAAAPWIMERALGWLNHSRRLSKCYERLTRTDAAWIYIAMTRIMLQRIA